MGISHPRRVNSQNRPAGRPRRTPRLLFDRLEDRLALAASPAFSINDLSLVEGNAGTIGATFTVSLSQASNKSVSVNYATSDGSAVAGSDFDPVSGTLTFAKGQTSRTITVPVRGDTLDEAAETFFVNLSAPSPKTTIGKGRGLGTILDNDPSPALSVNDVTISEADSGTAIATFDVTLSAPSSLSVTLLVSTADGTATGGLDYGVLPRTITFAPGETSQTIAIPIVHDLLDEDDETFFVNLSDPTNATVDDAQGVGTIVDDDSMPSLAINNVSIVEGNAGTQGLTFTVGLMAPSGRTVTVSYTTTTTAEITGPATADIDFTTTRGTLTFLPGTTTQTITVPIVGDTLFEPNEGFFVQLSEPVNALLAGPDRGLGTILNDDAPPPPPELSIGDATVTEGDTSPTSALFTVTLSAPSTQVVTVYYDTFNSTATAGSDYTATNGSLTFLPGQTSQTISVPIPGDLADDGDVTFFLRLRAPLNATIADGQGVGTILDNDPTPSLSISDATVTEGNAGSPFANFTVTLSAPSNRYVGFSYTTANGSATAGSDYTSVSGGITFLPHQTSQTISVPILDGTVVEPDEFFFLRLLFPGNATIADGEGVGTIVDNDPVPSISISDASVNEGDPDSTSATFTLTLSSAGKQVVTVSYTTANNSATAGSDYTSMSGTLTFLPGETSQTISVPVSDDAIDEPDQSFFVRLGTVVNATIADSQGVALIVDNDPPPSISISDASVIEGDVGTVGAFFTVTLSAVSERVVTVSFTTADGSATAGSDYGLNRGPLTFLPGQTSQTIPVPVLGDTTDEPDEFFFLRLNFPNNVTVADGEGVGTIVDDDPTPNLSFTIEDASVVEGDSGLTFLVFRVLLSGPSDSLEWVVFQTADSLVPGDGYATAFEDYTPQPSDYGITFLAGVTEQSISIPILVDASVEPDEVFYVKLLRASKTISDGLAEGTIINDD